MVEVNNSRKNIATMNSLLDISGDRAKYEGVYAAMVNNNAKMEQIQDALIQCDNKARKFKTSGEFRDVIKKAHAGQNDQNAAINDMASKHQHGEDKEFKDYLKAVFDQKPGSVSDKINYAYEKMDQDLKQLQESKAALAALKQAFIQENNELRGGSKNVSDPALHTNLAKTTEAVNIAATSQAVPPPQPAAVHHAAAGVPDAHPPALANAKPGAELLAQTQIVENVLGKDAATKLGQPIKYS